MQTTFDPSFEETRARDVEVAIAAPTCIELADVNITIEEASSVISGITIAATVVAGAGVVAAAALPETAQAAVTIGTATLPPADKKDAWRFLTQATFGPTEADLASTAILMSKGYVAWLNDQFAKQPTESTFEMAKAMKGAFNSMDGTLCTIEKNGADLVSSVVWQQFIKGNDQLRQRIAFALSEIFVVSFQNSDALFGRALQIASFHDILVNGAFGNFRTLLGNVIKSPAMAMYLSNFRNQRPLFTENENLDAQLDDGFAGISNVMTRIPDQNLARELMQLFTIGLVKLNMNGSPALSWGAIQESYTPEDIRILSFVLTGWAYYSGGPGSTISFVDKTGNSVVKPERGFYNTEFISNEIEASWPYMNMPLVPYDEVNYYYKSPNPNFPLSKYDYYPQHASKRDFYRAFSSSKLTGNKATDDAAIAKFTVQFLGKTFTPTGTCEGDLQQVLNILMAHQNIAPFISKQMIQRLVTSNPSAAYVQRVANKFKTNYSLQDLVFAILTDTEARDHAAVQQSRTYGKLREPILRVTAALRGLRTGLQPHLTQPSRLSCYVPLTYSSTGLVQTSVGQGPYQSASVFNFFRPGYVEPSSLIQTNQLVSPEFQIASAADFSGFSRMMTHVILDGGFGGAYQHSDTKPLFQSVVPGEVVSPHGVEIDSNYDWNILNFNGNVEKIPDANILAFIESLNKRFLGGMMVPTLKAHLTDVLTVPLKFSSANQAYYRLKRIRLYAISSGT